MKIGIISDSHDNIPNLNKALEILKKENAKVLLHCGDFCAPFMLKEMRKFDGDIHCIFGNIDDQYTSTKFAIKLNINLHGAYAELEFDRKKIALIHFPQIAEALALSGKFDLVCHGHSHKARIEKRNKTWLVNPGEIIGTKENPSCTIYNTENNKLKHIELK